ncbi:hypothetical protein A3J90_05945 [candidate division WOR-1 bacterium RIFOXYC2_FULL_37_10]|uniref:Uncharacterized protein n=1 Tax=candidate division WOR-1 bacterium RIFOXYB2_FULL_37_13 TaxID=1802579 RepID=A0A1F4SWM7_UNCSA|nr:MAG: hypothetical protein A2246_05680 [candidate division WOR-1 bacterium RIFOXYA2_FULL_37_7]OGC24841.1 MAG: hypothetical protein A2310_03780 [candidate division WOR-1 bacterium RIFOXYB2_FULL_37_13]OGC34927.1 MAG: hypothetical protein A3J90_05945 [candidate division WOR-1 bacterium RIFOXYC2_FULL_37_10]
MVVAISNVGVKLRAQGVSVPHQKISSQKFYMTVARAVNVKLLVDNLAEALTCKPKEVEDLLASSGYDNFNRVDPNHFERFAENILAAAIRKFGTGTKTLLGEAVPRERQLQRLDSALRNSLDAEKIVKSLARQMGGTKREAADLLRELGAVDIAVIGAYVPEIRAAAKAKRPEMVPFQILAPGEEIRQVIPGVKIGISQTEVPVPSAMVEPLTELFKALPELVAADSLPSLYREGIMDYYNKFMAEVNPKISRYILEHFGTRGPKYIVNSGIGGNEQHNHPFAKMHNKDFYYNQEAGTYWIMADSPAAFVAFIEEHPEMARDMNTENTLYMEFSRSGKTEETVKLHEFTPMEFKRIVFANSGPLRDLAERDGNLRLDLPDDVSGRYGFIKTPVLLAPAYVAGLDVHAIWQAFEDAAKAYDFSDPLSPPSLLARFTYASQRSRPNTNHMYLGSNTPVLSTTLDSLLQFVMEGINKPTNLGWVNNFSVSRYLGQPRDAHLTLEGILANAEKMMGLFLFTKESATIPKAGAHLINENIDPIDEAHRGMKLGQETNALGGANAERFCDLGMLSILIEAEKITPELIPWIDMLFADYVVATAKLYGIDPGSNPEVKYVRDTSALGLVRVAKGAYNLMSSFFTKKEKAA